MSFGSIIRVTGTLLLRAGWAPLLVFLTHITLHFGLDAFTRVPPLDIPMHALGGAAIAYFFSTCFQAIPAGTIALEKRKLWESVTVMALTIAVALFWELSEYLLDTYANTSLQLDSFDTFKDLAYGIAGGAAYLLIAWLSGNLGRVRPVAVRGD